MFKRREKFAPDLIDLVQYEKDLLYYKKHNITLMPPPGIGGLVWGEWTDSEMQAMRDNRKEAQKIYSEVKNSS